MTPFEIAAVIVTALAGLYDLRSGHIPNWLTFGSLGAALVAHAIGGAARAGLLGFGSDLGAAALGMLVCGLVPALVFFRGGIGGGDVKLFAALGALCGARSGLLAESYSFAIALLLAPAYLAYEGKLLRTLGNAVLVATNPFRRPETRRAARPELITWIRLAPAIFLGTLGMLALPR